jgi:hypothetical protein
MRLLILIVLKSSAGCHPIRITTLVSSDHVLRISLHEMFGSFQTVGFYGFANWVRPCSLLKYWS